MVRIRTGSKIKPEAEFVLVFGVSALEKPLHLFGPQFATWKVEIIAPSYLTGVADGDGWLDG